MTTEYEIFAGVLYSALSSKKIDMPDLGEAFNFEQFEAIAVNNSCLSLLCQALSVNNISYPTERKQFLTYTVLNSYKKLSLESEIIEMLTKNSIRCCILKGSSVAMNYPNPLTRSMGDIDVLVDEDNYESAVLMFSTIDELKKNTHKFHFHTQYKGVTLEIHKCITNDEKINSIISTREFLDNVIIKQCEGFNIPVLSPAYQAISLLSHMVRHFMKNQFMFRMFCDWVCFVNHLSDDEWQNEVYPMVEQIGFGKFSDALNRSAERFMGVDLKNKINSEADDAVCEMMMESFISVDKSIAAGSTNVNLGAIVSQKTMTQKNRICVYLEIISSIAHKKAEGKSKALYPLIWLLIPIRYTINMLLGRRQKLNFKEIVNSSDIRDKIYRELNLK